MKILFVSSRVPWPLRDGGAIASYQMLKGLKDQGNEITLFAFNTKKHFVSEETISKQFTFCRVHTHEIDTTPRLISALAHLLRNRSYNISRFNSATAVEQLRALLEKEAFDLVLFDGLYSTPLLDAIDSGNQAKKVLRQHNVEFRIWEKLSISESNILKRWYYRILAGQLKKYETGILKVFDAILPITIEDKDEMHQYCSHQTYFTCEVGVDIQDGEQDYEIIANRFFHIGSMEWIPNRNGVEWLIAEVWPLVKAAMPQAELHLAGKGLNRKSEALQGNGIFIHGEVDSAAEFMKSNGIMCIPLFSGGGIRVKLLEALAMSVPVVATPIAAAGINLENRKDLYISETAKDFAKSMIDLAGNPELSAAIGKHGREAVIKRYTLSHLMKELHLFLQSLVR